MTPLCPGCGATCRANARFCDQCGNALPTQADAPHGDRPELRQGTLLFCDLVQSTLLAHQLDHDDLRSVFSAVQRTVREVSRRHAGYVVRFVGDGAFVAFGYPAAQEDSAEAAVQAGLDFVRSIRMFRSAPQVSLEMRVGIASGAVVMGEAIDGAAIAETSITGRVAHLAARLVASAPPGGVVLCDDTRRLIGQRFALQPMGALELKGFPEPVTAWQAVAEAAPMSRFEAHRGSGNVVELIGRDAVLQQLADLWHLARDGQGQSMLLLGEAGIGKSRVVHALDALVAGADALPLDLHFTPRTSNTPLYPVGVLLRRLAGVEAADDEALALDKARTLLAPLLGRDRLDGALADLRPLFVPRAAVAASADSPELVRERSIALLVDLVRALAANRPLLLQVEDLHWSDATTRLLLQRLIAAATSLNMLALVTARDADSADLSGMDFSARIELQPLSADDATALVQRVAGASTLPAATVGWIVQRAEGNPLFLEELTRAACDARTPAEAIPATLQNVVQARLDRWPRLKPLVQAAAVLGREFSWPLLSRLTGEHGGLGGPVGQLLEDGILVATGAASYGALRFKHALIHDAVYQTLLRSERQRLHALAAELLAGEAAPDLLAHHLAQAGRVSDAIRCLVDASRDTAARAAHQESIGHANAGLKLVAQVDDAALQRSLHLRLLAQLALSLTATLGYAAPQVEQTYSDALALCDETTPPDELFPILRGFGTYYFVRGRLDQADRMAAQCLALAQRTGRADQLIDAHCFAAYPATYRGRLAEAQQALRTCVALYEAEGGERFSYPNAQDPGTAAWSLLTLVDWLRGDLHGALAAEARLAEHLARLDRPFDTAYGVLFRSASCQLHRRFAQAIEDGQAGLAIAQKHGFGTWTAVAMMQVSLAGGALTGDATAIATLAHVHGAFMQHGAEGSATFYLWGLAQGKITAGDLDGARAVLDDALRRAAGGDEIYMHAELLLLAASVEADAQRARDHLQAALRQAQAQQAHAVALRAACRLLLAEAPGADAAATARTALAVLDAQQPLPADPGWVAATLQQVQAALAQAGAQGTALA